MEIARRMRSDWDKRARENAMFYIDTRRTAWETETFFRGGRDEALCLLRPALTHLQFDPAGKRMLEIGCGIGRLFPGFAERFAEVWGIDVSAEMIRQAQSLCPVKNARFVLGSGEDLLGIESASVDYCFSYIVFQHISDINILWNYLDEVYRVLRPGGAFQLHFRADHPLRSALLLRFPHGMRELFTRLRHGSHTGDISTWTGVAVPPQKAITRLARLGFDAVETLPCTTFSHRSYWVIGRKPGR
jgi:ubiquinone/menaquinone biosynthesis C-methylase UbiE